MFGTFDLQTNKLTWDVKDCWDGKKYNLCAKELKSCPVSAPASAPTEGIIYQVIRMSNFLKWETRVRSIKNNIFITLFYKKTASTQSGTTSGSGSSSYDCTERSGSTGTTSK